MKSPLIIVNLKILVLGSLLLMILGCSIDKRLYTKGYHFQRKGITSLQKTNIKEKDINQENGALEKNEVLYQANVVIEKDKDFVADDYKVESNKLSASNKVKLDNQSKSHKSISLNAEDKPCDNIVLSNGDEISAVIEEIGENLIKYRKCENQSGPLYSISRKKVFMIKYSNGQKELFSAESENVKTNEDELVENKVPKNTEQLSEKEIKASAAGSFVLGLFGIILFALIALSFAGILSTPLWIIILDLIVGLFVSIFAAIGGNRTLVSIKKTGIKYTGSSVLAIMAIILGAISALGSLVFLFLLLI